MATLTATNGSTSSTDYTQSLPVFANTTYTVQIDVQSNAFGINFDGGNTSEAIATIDPTFEIAPQYQNQWAIQFSPNLSAPEPNTITLASVSLLMLAISLLRKKRPVT